MTSHVRSTPHRFTPFALALSLLLAPLATRADGMNLNLGSGAPPKTLIGSPSLGAPIGKISGAFLLGLDLPPSGLDVGPKLTGELMYAVTDLAPQLRLDLGARLAWAYHGQTGGGSSWLLDVVPDAKLRYGVSDEFGVYGDFGMGYAYWGGDFAPGSALAIQFGAGAVYAITPRMNLIGELRINIYAVDGSHTFVTVPTIGLEFH